jgi:hypothetical protein
MTTDNNSMRKQIANIAPMLKHMDQDGEIFAKLDELARRVDRLENHVPSSFIPQYKIRDDKEYTPLGGVLDKIFDEIDDLTEMMEKSQNDFVEENLQKLKDLENGV